MLISNTRDLGLRIREARQARKLSQQQVADAVGASRFWVIGMEAGKAAADIGLILKTLRVLGLTLDLRSDTAVSADTPSKAEGTTIDLGAILDRTLQSDP